MVNNGGSLLSGSASARIRAVRGTIQWAQWALLIDLMCGASILAIL